MTNTTNPQMVVVGIDGSRAATDAAMWAIEEAIDRDVSLRLHRRPGPDNSAWIVVGIDERPENERVVTRALDEARLRHAPVLAVGTWHSELGGLSYDSLEGRVALWRERFPDLHIRAVSTGGSLPQFLGGYRDDVRARSGER